MRRYWPSLMRPDLLLNSRKRRPKQRFKSSLTRSHSMNEILLSKIIAQVRDFDHQAVLANRAAKIVGEEKRAFQRAVGQKVRERHLLEQQAREAARRGRL